MSRKTPNFVGRFSKKISRRYFWEIFLPEGDVFHCKFLPLQVVQKTGVGWKIEPQLVGVQRLPGLMIAAVHIALAVLAVPQQRAADLRHGNADLVGAARQQTAFHQRQPAPAFECPVKGDGGLAAGLWAVRSGETAKADGVLFVNRYDPPETAAAAVTASAARAGTRTVKAAAPAALPQTGDGFPIEALAAAFCASVIGFGTAWKRR